MLTPRGPSAARAATRVRARQRPIAGWTFDPTGAVLPELFRTRVRCTGASLAYNLAGIPGASGAPYPARELVAFGGIGFVGVRIPVAAVPGVLAVLAMRETGGRAGRF